MILNNVSNSSVMYSETSKQLADLKKTVQDLRWSVRFYGGLTTAQFLVVIIFLMVGKF